MMSFVQKILIAGGLLLLVHSLYQELCAYDFEIGSFLQVQNKYIEGGQIEYITFASQNNAEDRAKIMRTGILIQRKDARGTVLLCHGFMCDKFDTGFLRLLFPNFNVMTFDFRAHGEHVDEKQLCTFGKDEACDVYAAVQYLRARPDLNLDTKPLVAFGFSMGAVAAIQAQAEHQNLFDLMILDCPYDDSENILKNCMENLKFNIFGYQFCLPGRSFLKRYAFNPVVQSIIKVLLKTVANLDATSTNTFIYPLSPAESVKKITIPCLFIHCINDEKVDVNAAKMIFANAAGYKRLWLTVGRRHFDSFFYNPEKYVYRVNKFINNVLSGFIANKKAEKIKHDLDAMLN